MTDDQFQKLCNVYGFAPNKSLREMLDCAVGQRKPLTMKEAFEWMDRAPRGLFASLDIGTAQAIWLVATDFTERAHGIKEGT